MLLVLGTLVGAVLGMRFKVLSLVPVTGLGCIFLAAAAIVRNDGVSAMLLSIVLLAASLQLGYLVGIGIRLLFAAAQATRVRSLPASAIRPNR